MLFNSMIAKTFVFSFINSYASFFFVAYFAAIVPKPTYPGQPPDDNIGMCGYPDCMQALAVDLGIVLASNIGTNMVFLIMDYVSTYLGTYTTIHLFGNPLKLIAIIL